MRLLPFPCVLAAVFLLCVATDVDAEVHHCVTADGRSVFTDRECGQLGATERPPGTPVDRRTLRPARCARTVHELSFELAMAIDARDTDRLADLYHWTGMTTRSAHEAWQRLDAIAQRPLADIVPITPDSPMPSHPSPRVLESASAGGPTGPMPAVVPAPPMRRDPVALRLEQTEGNGVRPAPTTLSLVRHFDCWWVRF